MSIDQKEAIQSCQIFDELSKEQIEKLSKLCSEEYFEPGSTIFVEGSPALEIYLVSEGQIALEMGLSIGPRTKRQVTIDVITPGKVFGWSALTERPARTASAICVEKARLIVIGSEAFRSLCHEDFELYGKVMSRLTDVVGDRLTHTKKSLAYVLSVATHDLKAPLATVQSCLDTILGGFTGHITDKQRDLLTRGKSRITDLTKMINNLLDISCLQLTKGDFIRLSLAHVVEDSLAEVQGMSEQKYIIIENNVSWELPGIMGQPRRLQQVITNLLSNAIKFTPQGGKVTISSSEKGTHVQISVADTGIGISAEDLPRIFDDFYQGINMDSGGAGIGLSIARRIISAHSGQIWAESPCPETGKGCRVLFTIPNL